MNPREGQVPAPVPGERLWPSAKAMKEWEAEKLKAWLASPELLRADRLVNAVDPALYGGLDKVAAAAATCVADFDRTYEATALRGRRLTEAELAARSRPTPAEPPAAPPGMRHRACSRCDGSGRMKPTGVICGCMVALGGVAGWELYAVPGDG